VADAFGGAFDEHFGQLLGCLGGEEAGMRVGDAIDLRVHGGHDVGMAVAQTRHGGAARGVNVRHALCVGDRDAAGARGNRQVAEQLTCRM